MATTKTTAAKAAKGAKADITITDANCIASRLIARYKSITAIKADAPALREKFGAKSWSVILKAAKDLRAAKIKEEGDTLRASIFTYDGVLAAVMAEAARRPEFKALVKAAREHYNRGDGDTAALLIRDYYSDVDAETGLPVSRIRYITAAGGMILEAWQPAALNKVKALSVLESALKGLQRAGIKAARAGEDGGDTAPRRPDNARPVGVIVAVRATSNDNGVTACGDVITTDSAKALIGKSVPANALLLADVVRAEREALKTAAFKALAERNAGIQADAAAAGVSTPARAKGKGKGKAVVDGPGSKSAAAFVASLNAAAKEEAVALNA